MAANSSPPPGLLTASNPPFRPQTRSPIVSFQTRDVGPPSEVYVTINDLLFLQVWNSLAGLVLNAEWRVLRADGTIIRETEQLTLNSNRIEQTFSFNVPEGFLLSFVVRPVSGTPLRGQCWAQASIAAAVQPTPIPYQVLVADYVTFSQYVAWPGGAIHSSVEGAGFIYTNQSPSPGAGPTITWIVPLNSRWIVRAGGWQYTTDAVGGARTMSILWAPNGLFIYLYLARTTQPVSVAYVYDLTDISTLPTDSAPNPVYMQKPQDMFMGAGGSLLVSANGKDAGDSYTNPGLHVEEWLDPIL